MANVTRLQVYGNLIKVIYDDASTDLAYPTSGGLWIVKASTPPDGGGGDGSGLIDTISSGHHITNPGGTVASGWQWHIDNNGGRGGDDWNYSYGTKYKAPGAGTVTHFDVAGVGMVVKLVLDTPATPAIHALQPHGDAGAPMKAIWFQHGSAAYDGHCEQGDVIGKSGNGYGAYAAHLHVHGMTDTGDVAGSDNRTCFWDYV